MPRYDFKCGKCGAVTEISASFSEELVAPTCCQQPMTRDYSSPTVVFNAPGFYVTDNKK
jgi:putative FmdB family regulatory protein